jgi:hypothetical protein
MVCRRDQSVDRIEMVFRRDESADSIEKDLVKRESEWLEAQTDTGPIPRYYVQRLSGNNSNMGGGRGRGWRQGGYRKLVQLLSGVTGSRENQYRDSRGKSHTDRQQREIARKTLYITVGVTAQYNTTRFNPTFSE